MRACRALLRDDDGLSRRSLTMFALMLRLGKQRTGFLDQIEQTHLPLRPHPGEHVAEDVDRDLPLPFPPTLPSRLCFQYLRTRIGVFRREGDEQGDFRAGDAQDSGDNGRPGGW